MNLKFLDYFSDQVEFKENNQQWLRDNIPSQLYKTLSASILEANVSLTKEKLLKEYEMYVAGTNVINKLKDI
jgi:hypothetical protein